MSVTQMYNQLYNSKKTLESQCLNALQAFFGYPSFRTHQLEAITAVLNKKDCMVVLATGTGKSMCYTIPALVSKKPCIVISPLISLMNDQVSSLNQRNISAVALHTQNQNSFTDNQKAKSLIDFILFFVFLCFAFLKK